MRTAPPPPANPLRKCQENPTGTLSAPIGPYHLESPGWPPRVSSRPLTTGAKTAHPTEPERGDQRGVHQTVDTPISRAVDVVCALWRDAVPMAASAVVDVVGLEKSYGANRAVAGIDLQILTGEIVAILGPNGAGKTTTVEILEGYRRADGGKVRVLGEDPARAGARWRARRGIVLQSCQDLGELTVAEVVHHFARYYPSPADPAEVIARVGLAEKARARVRSLSGGQRRRVDVALGIVGRPELLFLDEPTTGFDPEARRGFWRLIEALRKDGTTILLTTHYMEEAEALADRVVVVNRGEIVAEGSAGDLGGDIRAWTTVSWADGNERRSIRTKSPTQAVMELKESFGGEIPALSVSRASLEDVYLSLVGQGVGGPDISLEGSEPETPSGPGMAQ